MTSSDVGSNIHSSFWLANIKRQGKVAYGSSSFQVFRNVLDFGAKGDGTADDTAAINAAISTGGRCGRGCDSSTTTPAIVYFPPGTYLVSKPIIQYYYTQFIGDAVHLPVIKASSSFEGIAVLDSDPYEAHGINWYTNQNNFFRQIRNFVIDLTALPESKGSGIHWQVAQATSLQNITFNMHRGGTANKQNGIFMDNGSGGFMSDLTFNGGNYGAFFGNQQFTTRNLTFNGCNTAIYMNWNWLWALKSVFINDCGLGIDMCSGAPGRQSVGSITLQDSVIHNTPVGIRTAFGSSSEPVAGGALIIDNVDFRGCTLAVQGSSNEKLLAGGSVIKSWIQGRHYVGRNGSRVQKEVRARKRPKALVSESGAFVERSKPQYEDMPASRFVSVKSRGAKGDGVSDDSDAIQAAMDAVGDDILYFDHGAYVVSRTIRVPKNIKITGEIWPLIMAKGAAFQDQRNPQPVWQIGKFGDVGNVEISDLLFETIGPQPGAILIEFNVAGSSPGMAGLWDVHCRIGGSAGTQLQSDTCSKDPAMKIDRADPKKIGAFLLFHATTRSSVYLENCWFWVADHELDLADHNQIDVYTGRGVLLESQLGTWLYGTAAEHCVLYNYAIGNARNVFMSAIQTETPYFQSNPDASTPFGWQARYFDPNFEEKQGAGSSPHSQKSWGMLIKESEDVLVYGAGMYSFFENYDQACLSRESCQQNMVDVRKSKRISLYGVSTKAADAMITCEGEAQAFDADNRSNFCATLALWTDADDED